MRIWTLKKEALEALESKNYFKVLQSLGRALHTIQDFYSHSNYADLYVSAKEDLESDPDSNIDSLSALYRMILSEGEDGVPVWNFLKFRNREGGAKYHQYIEGSQNKDGTNYHDITCHQFEGSEGDANFYGFRGYNRITTGYFPINLNPLNFDLGDGSIPWSKCRHGTDETKGIAHDNPPIGEASDSLVSKRFYAARDMAVEASHAFIQDFLDDARSGDFEDVISKGLSSELFDASNRTASRTIIPINDILTLMGQESAPEVNIGFLVDTTGSMGSTITGVKSAISRVVDDINSGSKSISKFLVMVYGDPDFGDISIVDNTEDMTSSIDAITLGVPNGGGDCPERTTEAIRLAVNAAPNNTSLFVYTDASSKETELADAIIAQARAKSIGVNFFVSGNCGSVSDDIYSTIAQGTGGVVSLYEHNVAGAEGTFAQINPVFVGNLQEGIRNQSKLPALAASRSVSSEVSNIGVSFPENMGIYSGQGGNSSNIILPETAIEKLNRRARTKAVAARGVAVPAVEAGMTAVEEFISVDSSATSLVVTVDMSPLGLVKLYKPDGTEVLASDDDVSVSDSSVGITFTVSSPTAGAWKAYIEGTPEANYNLSAKMNSSVNLLSFSFTEIAGRSGHKGLFPIVGQPSVSGAQTFSLLMGGSVETAELVLKALDGTELSTSSLSRIDKAGKGTYLTGSIELPSESFRVYVEGKDKDGNDYSRVHPNIYLGQSVSIASGTVIGSPIPGGQVKIEFDVHNIGLTDIFDITTTNSEAYSSTVSVSDISVAESSSGKVTVTLDIPADAAADKAFTVTLKAQSQTNTESANTSTVGLVVNADTDGDGVSDTDETLRSQSDVEFDGNSDGTPDWQQANVASVYTQSGSVMTLELSSGEFSSLEVIADPSSGMDKPDGASFPSGYFAYTLSGLTEGAETALRIHYPLGYVPSRYYRYGPTTALAAPAWNEHAGTEFGEKFALLSLTDGADGDNDLLANSTIIGKGGFGFIPNQRPSTTTDIYTTKVNKPITTLNVLSNDSDPDGDSFTLSDASTTSTSGGTVVNHGDGTFTYSPAEGYIGEDAFIYFVTDSKNAQAVGRVKITVEKGVVSGDTETGGGGSVGWLGLILGIGLAGSLYIRRSVFSALKREAKS